MSSKPTVQGIELPNKEGFFGDYGGAFIPPSLEKAMADISAAYEEIKDTDAFKDELKRLFTTYSCRPTPLYHAQRLSVELGGAQIFLKREDLNQTGAHKINHSLGEALLAKHMGKKRVIAETGAGQHGVAMATACALLGIECVVYMGAVDVAKQLPNVAKMKLLGAKVVPVEVGQQTLKEAVDVAFQAYLADPETQFYAIGSVVGPHPFPGMVQSFQKIVGEEIKAQVTKQPDYIVACVGGGSNAIGAFTAFLNDQDVKLVGVEPAGRGLEFPGEHSATLTLGKPGVIHGMRTYVLADENGQVDKVHSIASGLDYPGIGPVHGLLKDIGRVTYSTVTDSEALNAYVTLSRTEGIIPALESSHAVAWVLREAPKMSTDINIVINLSGRGDKDIDFVMDKLGM